MNLKIYYDYWQMECCGEAFKTGDEICWYGAKFSGSTKRVFKDADYSYEAHGEEKYKITGIVAQIWAIYYPHETNGEFSAPYKLAQISNSKAYESEFKGLKFGAYLVELQNASAKELIEELYEKFERDGKFNGKIISPNQKDANGQTLLNLAVIAGDAPSVQRLLDGGARVNLAGAEGFTPLHHACFCKNQDIFRLLLSFGADLNAKNGAGLSVLECIEGDFLGSGRASSLKKIIKNFNRRKGRAAK